MCKDQIENLPIIDKQHYICIYK